MKFTCSETKWGRRVWNTYILTDFQESLSGEIFIRNLKLQGVLILDPSGAAYEIKMF